jgi:hypothetical protein
MVSKQSPKPPSRSPPPGASPQPPPGLIEAALLQRLALLSPGDKEGDLLLSDNYSLILALNSTTTGGGRPTRCGVTTCTRGYKQVESPSATPRAGVGFCSLRGGEPRCVCPIIFEPSRWGLYSFGRSYASLLSRCNSPAGAQRNDLPQACILINERSSQVLCLGRVNELS